MCLIIKGNGCLLVLLYLKLLSFLKTSSYSQMHSIDVVFILEIKKREEINKCVLHSRAFIIALFITCWVWGRDGDILQLAV